MTAPSPAAETLWTVERFLAEEATSQQKHHFVNGERIAMAGGTTDHGLLAMRLGSLLLALFAGDEKVYGSDVLVQAGKRLFYPDVSVVCEKEQTIRGKQILLNPTYVFEVLSHTTASFDMSVKLPAYLSIPSVVACYTIEPSRKQVNRYRRLPTGETAVDIYTDGEFPVGDVTVSLDKLYRGVLPQADRNG